MLKYSYSVLAFDLFEFRLKIQQKYNKVSSTCSQSHTTKFCRERKSEALAEKHETQLKSFCFQSEFLLIKFLINFDKFYNNVNLV